MDGAQFRPDAKHQPVLVTSGSIYAQWAGGRPARAV